MTWCRDAINSLFSILKTTELVDVFDILVLSYLVYWVIKLVRETRAGQLMKGIVLLFIAYIIAKFLQMKVVSYLMEQAFSIGVIALMIMFQAGTAASYWKRWGIVSGGCPLDSLRPQEMQPSGGRRLKRFAMPAWNCLQRPPVH